MIAMKSIRTGRNGSYHAVVKLKSIKPLILIMFCFTAYEKSYFTTAQKTHPISHIDVR